MDKQALTFRVTFNDGDQKQYQATGAVWDEESLRFYEGAELVDMAFGAVKLELV